jgi:hypothetical protein
VGINLNEDSDSDFVQAELKNQVSTNADKIETENNVEKILDSFPESKQDGGFAQGVDSKKPSGGFNNFLRIKRGEFITAKEDADSGILRNESSISKLSVIDYETGSDFKINPGENPMDSISNNELEKGIDTDPTQRNNAEADDKRSAKPANQIFIRALASPDLSSINYGSTRLMGSNYALLGEYKFSNRWSFSTGVIWSMKKYSTNDEVVYSGYSADQLDGACRILDIPINFYYHFFPEKKVSFYSGVGLSSYIMLKEDYTYTVFAASGDRTYATQVEGKNNEWFKVLNLSVGIQYPISTQWHIQAEPFLKAPLAGIGEGDVLLSSLGVFLGLKYKINLIK